MATVFDVAKYIVDKLGSVDTWKLQKLVYYCQAWSLVWDERPMFGEPIEAWANGPVCRALYERHRGKFAVGPDTPIWSGANPNILTKDEHETIEAILGEYGDKPGHWLRELTHLEEPWKQARGDTPPMESCSNVITHESMRLYYGAL